MARSGISWGSALVVICLATAVRETLADHEGTSCPTARKYLTCVGPLYTLPNLTTALTKYPPPYPIYDFPGTVDLRKILPLNDAERMTYDSVPHKLHQCIYPVLPASKVLKWANDKNSSYHTMFKACTKAPMMTGDRNYYIFGAFSNMSALTKTEIADLPEFQVFKTFYTDVGPELSMCMAVNPCLMNMFIGLENLKKYVTVTSNGAQVVIRPSQIFYSFAMDTLPPSWRGQALPSFWQINSDVWGYPDSTDVGKYLDISTVTVPQGRHFLSGPMLKDASVVDLPCGTVDLGAQKNSWMLLRDETRVAVSYRLDTAPNFSLWGLIDLPLRGDPKGMQIKNVDLITRLPTCNYWMTAQRQKIPAHLFVGAVPALGAIIERFYENATVSSGKRIGSIDVYGNGPKGTAVRVGFNAGSYKLTPGAARILERPALFKPFALIFQAYKDSSTFEWAVQVDFLNGGSRLVRFCDQHADCPGDLYPNGECADKDHVCLTFEQAAASAAFSIASASAGHSSPSPPPGSQLLGEPCSSSKDCHPSLWCAAATSICRE